MNQSPPHPTTTATGPVSATHPVGLYDGAHEHDACGVAFVATLRGYPGHDIVAHAITALHNLDHRGAVGAEPDSGDGAGILTQVPDRFLRAVLPVELPEPGRYAVGLLFLPAHRDEGQVRRQVDEMLTGAGLKVLAWREVPTRPDIVGPTARTTMPLLRQVVVASATGESGLDLERRVWLARKVIERHTEVYPVSLSSRTLTYKGMLTTTQLAEFFPDLTDARFESRLAVVHSRFSTNTFPSWPLAHPYRMIAHNGEINTVRGNRNWMHARESNLTTTVFPGELADALPICTPGASDSATFDEVVELLHLGGRSLPHAVLMMVPEAWENNAELPDELRAFYEFHGTLMEPWDGPMNLVFTDGTQVGGVLDRNGLRPSRYWVTEDGLVVLGSETGVLPIPESSVVRKGRVEPGRMFLVDTAAGEIVDDHALKAQLAARAPYRTWLQDNLVRLEDLPERVHVRHTHASVTRRQQIFGYTEEELRIILSPMAQAGTEPLGAMGSDTPIAALSTRPRLLFDYFVGAFAQVTNPPLDAIREEIVTSLASSTGPEANLLEESPAHARQVVLDFPVIDNDQLAALRHINLEGQRPDFAPVVIRGLYRVDGGGDALEARLEEICAQVSEAVARGAFFIVLSDRHADREHAPIPSLLLTSAVHHHLVREHTRTRVGLLVEAGDVREVHHVALLVAFGAAAVNPYLAMESVEDLCRSGQQLDGLDPDVAIANLIRALGKGVLKVMSKMGISTVSSYRGAQTFEALGLSRELVDRWFTGTTSQLDGVGLDVVAEEVRRRHSVAYPLSGITPYHRNLDVGGEYQWRREGPPHLFNPETVFRLQHSTRTGRYDIFRRYTDLVDHQAEELMTLRGLLRLTADREPVPLEEVEPVQEIVRRFATGAMSYGSISREAHETLAIAMNRLGGRSNSGEGGEEPDRLLDPERRSAIKQVASGRFGVTSAYLVSADDIQIKVAQGAKPGEGGQLPPGKVYPWIAATRHSTPGVGLISPPPHHDIYSIEDLAQLIHDLKNANPRARVHVKLVSQVGVGTVAAGVAKAHADVVLISGFDGGTGASPLTSLKHAGTPWELGLAETQQTLLRNGLRDRITVQVDGQLKTGRDVIIAALLGAEEFGFATAALVVSGCVMMRVCHLDTCPVGVATQNPELRERFTGQAEHVITFFEFIAEQVREQLAALGYRTLDEVIGRVDLLDTVAAVDHWKAAGLDLAPILHAEDVPEGTALRRTRTQDHGLDRALDHDLIAAAQPALLHRSPVTAQFAVRNVHRTVGTLLGHEVTRRHGPDGLPDGTIDVTLTGSAGQSLGAFLPRGIRLRMVGDANDYVGKGLSGGHVVVRPPEQASFVAADQVIAGNVIGYGATSGQLNLRGRVGERFCVRNSGAVAVVEGVGDHALEYMTGGTVLILGPTGRNLGAGMSGGTAYCLDLVSAKVNQSALTTGDLLLEQLEPGGLTAGILHALLTEHVELTGSSVAQDVLATPDWPARFTQITPRTYAGVLRIRDEVQARGDDPDGPHAWQLILEDSHG
ncbi:glutamate synthase large subunit [Ornithinimicrobium cryptoxanthini]|uniref:Glutamate synthase large subunit n=1 Tax=Ornithinimicrobium cryptoxanthini TaxID=2934161 RepID=A0ABY4YEI6_9MICO|nr:glutamate synthase large subunit [Ornithinimicrobium cryptoxanthini]USQ74931.1 glutamate synthase large subunit [Ornithinimicrobium cryptoxanthini]